MPSALVKILGMYKLEMLGKASTVIVMENLFYGRQISTIYDLKGRTGAGTGRPVTSGDSEKGTVRLDHVFRQDFAASPLLLW